MNANLKQERKRELQNSHEKMSVKRNFDNRACSKFSKWAREYICAYHKISREQQVSSDSKLTKIKTSEDVNVNSIATPIKAEKLVKLFMTHRCVLDFNHSFCKATYTA